MNKMTKPEMDVVRFQESDVIVASTIYLGNYNDTFVGNGFIRYKGVDYNTNGGDTVYQNLKTALGGKESFVLKNGEYHVESVYYFENAVDSYSQVEGSGGTYRWSGSSWIFSHQ